MKRKRQLVKRLVGLVVCGWQTFCKRNFEGLCKSFFYNSTVVIVLFHDQSDYFRLRLKLIKLVSIKLIHRKTFTELTTVFNLTILQKDKKVHVDLEYMM